MILDPKAYEKALSASAKDMTKELRKDARKQGWHEDVLKNMRVKYSDETGFTVKVHPDYEERAFVHEFGSPSTHPTAVIRKFRNRSTKSEELFLKHLEKYSE